MIYAPVLSNLLVHLWKCCVLCQLNVERESVQEDFNIGDLQNWRSLAGTLIPHTNQEKILATALGYGQLMAIAKR